MSSNHICGVYVIEQIGTDRCYVGSSQAIHNRWYQHRLYLRRGKHHSEFLQRAWDKHGKDAFEFRVLEKCEPNDLEAKEQQYIDALKPEFNGLVVIRPRKLHPEIETKRLHAMRNRTHCFRGHEYLAVGLGRLCPVCKAARHLRRRAKLAAMPSAQREAFLERKRGGPRRGHSHYSPTPEIRAQISATLKARSDGHCPNGHEYTEASVYIAPDGKRHCRVCRADRKKNYRANMTPEQHARMLETKRKDYHRHGDANRSKMRQHYHRRVI